MTFGYLGYIWALMGCCCLSLVFGGSALALYAVARKDRDGGNEAKITVERIDRGGPPDAA